MHRNTYITYVIIFILLLSTGTYTVYSKRQVAIEYTESGVRQMYLEIQQCYDLIFAMELSDIEELEREIINRRKQDNKK